MSTDLELSMNMNEVNFFDNESELEIETDHPIDNNAHDMEVETNNKDNENKPKIIYNSYYMSLERYKREYYNSPLILLDIQFNGSLVSEITMASSFLDILYHRKFVDIGYQNRKYYDPGYAFLKQFDMNFFCDVSFFSRLPSSAIVILRGKDKKIAFESIWKRYNNKTIPLIFTFPHKFNKSRYNSIQYKQFGDKCWSVENVCQMAKYYNLYENLFNVSFLKKC